MRVLMTTDTVGGVWSYCITLADMLARAGVEIHLVTSGPALSEAQRVQAASVRGLCLHEIEFKLEWMNDPWSDLRRWLKELRAVVDKVRPDLLHSNAFAPAAERWEIPVLLVAHSCVCTWWRAVRGCEAPADYERYRRVVSKALHGADAVLTPTSAFAGQMSSEYRVRRPIDVVHNGRPRGFSPGRKQPYVVGVGRLWDEAKNVAALASAAHSIGAPVVAIGDTGDRERTGVVRWIGTIGPSGMRRWLGMASVFAHPATYEPFGLAPLEAAASGCALVLADIPTLRELWSGAAEFIEPRDPRAIARAVNGLLDDDLKRERLAAAAIERARRYSADAMAERYLSMYRQLCGVTRSDVRHREGAAAR